MKQGGTRRWIKTVVSAKHAKPRVQAANGVFDLGAAVPLSFAK